MLNQKIVSTLLLSLFSVAVAYSQQAWFVDGYHGGVYGHYPEWQARFMVDKLTEIPDWKISLEIEPETWDSVSVNDSKNFKDLQLYYSETGRFGRIEFTNPTWSQPYCYNISGESLIRQFAYGINKIKEYFPEATFTTYAVEEPCFTSGMPQILKGFNFQYAALRCPNTCWGGYTTAYGKDLVNWIGPDGTSMLSVPRYGVEELSTENCFATTAANLSEEFVDACYKDGIKYPVGMCYQDAGWKHGPWIGAAVKNYHKPMQFTTWTEYINKIKSSVTPTDWKFSVEDVKPGLVWGSQVLQKIAREVRVSENKLVMAEKMAAFDWLLTGREWPTVGLAEAWRTLMLAQHHDCWIVPYNLNGNKGLTWAGRVTEWTDASNRFANNTISQVLAPRRERSRQNRFRERFITVFNTLGHERIDIARLPMSLGQDMSIVDAEGNIVPSQIITDLNGDEHHYILATVPSAGYSTYSIKRERPSQAVNAASTMPDGKVKVETEYYTAIFDPAKGGGIISLIDKRAGNKELVEKGKTLNTMRGYFYKQEEFRQSEENTAKVSIIDDGALFTRIKVVNFIADNPYCQIITFNRYNPRIDFELKIDWYGQPGIGAYDQTRDYKAEVRSKAFYNDYYKLHLQFPLQGVGNKVYKNSPFDVTESQLNNTFYSSWDSIKHNVIVNWLDVEGQKGDYGVALFSDHTTSYLNSPEMPLGLTVQYVGRGLWGRMYRLHGPTLMRYAILPHEGDWIDGEIEMASADWNEPLSALITGKLASSEMSLLQCLDTKLQLSSMTVSGNDLLLRFYNTTKSNKHQIAINVEADNVEIVNLLGEKQSDAAMSRKDGKLVIDLEMPQFRFTTIRLNNARLNNKL